MILYLKYALLTVTAASTAVTAGSTFFVAVMLYGQVTAR